MGEWNSTLAVLCRTREQRQTPYVLDRCTEVQEVYGAANYHGKKAMTLGTCFQYCSAKNGFYMGLTNGKKCWCGQQYQAYIGGSHSCDVKCQGNKEQYCGGRDATSVYIIGGTCAGDKLKAKGESKDKNLGEADEALDKVVKVAQKMADKDNKKLEIEAEKLIDDAMRKVSRAAEEKKKDRMKDLIIKARAKNRKARKIFKKMQPFGGGKRTGREKSALKNIKR